jgi:hypothetical protein
MNGVHVNVSCIRKYRDLDAKKQFSVYGVCDPSSLRISREERMKICAV